MKALIVERDGSVSIREVPVPQYNDYEVLVKMQASAICGSDTKILHNTLKGFSDYPTILGHEGVGEICKVGKKVRSLKIGDKLVGVRIFGKCGDYFATMGAMAEYAIAGDLEAMTEDGLATDENVVQKYVARRKIPGEIESVGATMIITFREVYSAMKRWNFTAGQNIVVYGAGPVGLTFVKLAKLIGMNPVICIDIDDQKIINAKSIGADIVFNSQKNDVNHEIKKLFPNGADILVDAVGVPSLINNNLKMVKYSGQICVYGVTPNNELLMNWQEAPYTFDLRFGQWTLNTQTAAVHEEIVQWMVNGKLNGMDFISDVFSFEDSLKAIVMYKAHKNQKKIVLKF
jgi:D-arabinose 1-dehydrogenase-like Zn-dependent alcohol dehydrogenase